MIGSIILLVILICIIKLDLINSDLGFSPLIAMLSIVMTALFITNRTIDPIEVYRGNTTLKIIYKDSISIDSIVVLKNK